MKTLHLCIIPLGMTQEWPIFVIPTSFRHSRMRMNEMMLTTFHIGKGSKKKGKPVKMKRGAGSFEDRIVLRK